MITIKSTLEQDNRPIKKKIMTSSGPGHGKIKCSDHDQYEIKAMTRADIQVMTEIVTLIRIKITSRSCSG